MGILDRPGYSRTQADMKYGQGLDADSNGVVATDAANCWSQLNAVLNLAVSKGVPEVILRSASYDLTGGRVLVPAGVTLKGANRSVTLKGGAYAVASKGTIKDLNLDAGWTEHPSPLLTQTGNLGGTAIIGGRVDNVTRQNDATLIFPRTLPHGLLPNTIGKLRNNAGNQSALMIATYGHSLMEGAGASPKWQDITFQPAYNINPVSSTLAASSTAGTTSLSLSAKLQGGLYIIDAGLSTQEVIFFASTASGASAPYTGTTSYATLQNHASGATIAGLPNRYIGAYYNLQFSSLSSVNRLDNRAVGGTYSHLLTAHHAVTRDMANAGGLGLNAADGTRYGAIPRLADYDLILVSASVNNPDSSYQYSIESFVKAARDAGCEVIIIAEQSHQATPTDMNGNRELWQRMAAAYGCVFADVNSAYLVAQYFGDVTSLSQLYYDTVHPSNYGHWLWADVVLGAIRDYDPKIPYSYRPPKRRVFQQANVTLGMPNHTIYESRPTPTAQSAGVSSIAPTGTDTTTVKNPRYHKDITGNGYVYAPPATPITHVPVGDYVEYAVESAYDLILVTEQAASPPTVTITCDAGATSIYTGWTPSSNNTGRLFASALGRSTLGTKGISRTIRIACTAGTLNIVSAVFETLPKRGPFRLSGGGLSNASKVGTWSLATSTSCGVTNLDVTDTTGDYVEVDVTGDSVWLALGSSPYAGQVKITVDDVVINASKELYQAGASNLYTLCVPNLGHGRHRVRFDLVGVNGSATAVSSSAAFGHRLTVFDVSGVLSDNRSTLADLMS